MIRFTGFRFEIESSESHSNFYQQFKTKQQYRMRISIYIKIYTLVYIYIYIYSRLNMHHDYLRHPRTSTRSYLVARSGRDQAQLVLGSYLLHDGLLAEAGDRRGEAVGEAVGGGA